MNEHLKPIFETVLPVIESGGIPYWIYGGVAIAGINGDYVRYNLDVDTFVTSDDYDKTINLITLYETGLNWEHRDAKPQRGRRKREWRIVGSNRDILSVIEVYPVGKSVRFIFGTDFIPQNPLSTERRTIGDYSFVTPSKEFMKELLMSKVNSGSLNRDRIRKLKIDAKVVMTEDEYVDLCVQLDAIKR